MDKSAWTKKVIVSLHEYAYNMWKKRNTFIHGEHKKVTNKDSWRCATNGSKSYNKWIEVYSHRMIEKSLSSLYNNI